MLLITVDEPALHPTAGIRAQRPVHEVHEITENICDVFTKVRIHDLF